MAASTRSIHSRQRAAGGKSTSSTSKTFVPFPRATARCGGHRPYSRNAGRPVSSLAALSAPTGRTVGARRGRSSAPGAPLRLAETQSSAEQQLDDFGRRFGAQFVRDGEQGLRAAGRSAARSSAEAAASAIAPAAVFAQAGSPGLGRPPPADRRVRIQDFRRDQRQRPRPAQPDGEGEVERQRARISASAAGASGKTEKPRRRPWRRPRPDRPPLRKPSGWMRGRSGPAEPGRARAAAAASRPGSRPGGRPASSRQSRSSFAAGRVVADGEAQVAQRAFVGVEAQDLG